MADTFHVHETERLRALEGTALATFPARLGAFAVDFFPAAAVFGAGGQTPRQAVKTAAGRAKVEVLLAGMGRPRASGSLDLKPPVARIGKKLGLG